MGLFFCEHSHSGNSLLFHCLLFNHLVMSRHFSTSWTAAHQAPLSMGFPRQEYWSELLFPSPGDLPDPGIKSRSPALQAHSSPSEPPGKSFPLETLPKQNLRPTSFRLTDLLVTIVFNICSFHPLTIINMTCMRAVMTSNWFSIQCFCQDTCLVFT